MNEMHDSNRKWWDTTSPDWKKRDEAVWKRLNEQGWNKCEEQPDIFLDGTIVKMIREYIGDMKDKKACVISSGDNFAAFALSAMGAHVTSTDISEKRLDIARERAKKIGQDIRFFQCDSMNLTSVEDNGFDLVCSTPGTYVWLSDLGKVYSEVNRILKPEGFFIMREIHPFTRPWVDQPEFEIAQPYWETGPYVFEEPEGTMCNFYWMMSDFINSLAASGLVIRRVSEEPAEEPSYWEGVYYGEGGDKSLLDWHVNPRAALPQWMVIAARKPRG